MKTIVFLFCCLLAASVGQAQVIHVPADYSTIHKDQRCKPWRYRFSIRWDLYEQINFLGKKPLVVASQFLMDGDTKPHYQHDYQWKPAAKSWQRFCCLLISGRYHFGPVRVHDYRRPRNARLVSDNSGRRHLCQEFRSYPQSQYHHCEFTWR